MSKKTLPPAVYGLIGLVVALVLQVASQVLAMSYARQVLSLAHQAGGDRPTMDQFRAATSQLAGLHWTSVAVGLIAFIGKCALAYWIGARTAPKWGWGLTPALPQLLVALAVLLGFLEHTMHFTLLRMAMPQHMFVRLELRAVGAIVIIILAAFIGGQMAPDPNAPRREHNAIVVPEAEE